jgi:DNA repair protein RecN (Recombination protein N)
MIRVMLVSLRVKNFAIAEDVTVKFRPGLNVITGETGAGKSILIAALGLILGERAEKSLIRTGESQCSVEAVFQPADPQTINTILEAAGLDPLEDGQLIVRRGVAVDSPGRVHVNDTAATVSVLKAIGQVLVDLHGPHDHQSLLDPDFQLQVLDAFGNLDLLRSAYEEIFKIRQNLQARLQALDGEDIQISEQLDLLTHQVNEIETADISVTDQKSVETEHTRASNAQHILEQANMACNALTEGEASAFEQMTVVQRALRGLREIVEDTDTWIADAEAIAVQIQELSRTMQQSVIDIESSPERMLFLENRKAAYESLDRKYGPGVEEILAHLEKARQRKHDLETRDVQAQEIGEELAKINEHLLERGDELGKRRRTAAKRLVKEVTSALRDLGFSGGAFQVNFVECRPKAKGLEDVEFGFAPNPGETLRALRAIASSGEISRVMLATKAVLAEHDKIPILIFDEVDANLGGEMGSAVGVKLAHVAEGHQVICITHLPQVAVHGASHFAVAKEVHDERTFTRILQLDSENRVDEIARMLGGENLTSVTREHARQMLEKSERVPSGKTG